MNPKLMNQDRLSSTIEFLKYEELLIIRLKPEYERDSQKRRSFTAASDVFLMGLE
ncbi:MAG: hypothetical protein ACFE98_14870 [Candidatus Hermodarchaeota archaeon]